MNKKESTEQVGIKKSFYFFAFGAMFLVGLTETTRTGILPNLRAELGIDYSMLGLLLFVSFLGFLISAFFAGYAGDRLSDKKVLMGGLVIMVSSLVLVNLASGFIGAIVTITIIRIGSGTVDIGLNAIGGRWFRHRAAVKMNLLHFFFGLGAAAGPLYSSKLIASGLKWQQPYFYIAPVALLFIIILLFIRIPHPTGHLKKQSGTLRMLLSSRRIWLYAGVMGIGLITEISLGDWLKNFLILKRGMTEISSGTVLTFYYLLFTVSRLFNGFITDRIGYARTIFLFYIAALIIFCLALAIPAVPFLFAIIGWFVSPMFPTAMLLVSRDYRPVAGASMGLVLTTGGLMQSGFSWVIGIAHDLFGVTIGFSTIGLGMVGGIIIGLLLGKSERAQAMAQESSTPSPAL